MSVIHTLIQRLKHTLAVLNGRDLSFPRQIRCQRLYLGNERARWCICPTELSSDSVVYSFGIGNDISFDLALIERFGLRVHAFDPTPRSLKWLDQQQLPGDLLIHRYGIGTRDGTCSLYPPDNPEYVSHSIIAKNANAPAIDVPVHKLSTIMKLLGHDKIDVLKVDIEGAEYEVLNDLLSSSINVGQLLVEFHHRWHSVGPNRTRTAVSQLNDAGFYIFNISPNGEEYSFMRSAR